MKVLVDGYPTTVDDCIFAYRGHNDSVDDCCRCLLKRCIGARCSAIQIGDVVRCDMLKVSDNTIDKCEASLCKQK